MNKERDKWDEDIRAKLFDHEVELIPEDWEAIANRLPEQRRITWPMAFRYWLAAAAAILAIVVGGLYLLDADPAATDYLVQERTESTQPSFHSPQSVITDRLIANPSAPSAIPLLAQTATSKRLRQVHAQLPAATVMAQEAEQEDAISATIPSPTETYPEAEEQSLDEATITQTPLTKVAETAEPTISQPSKQRKWSFGMGAGNLSVGTNQLVPHYVSNSTALRSESLISMNTWGATQEDAPKTDIRHHTPISFGLSVSRQLSNRFYLQTGLNYSYLRSEWSTNGTYHIEADQRLHFIGLPLSIAYRIAEWNRFLFYASAGGMAEVNVAGKQQSQLFSDEIAIVKQTEHIRMKEWLWSVNGKVGVSYPIVRFVSAFGEVSANYYFDNGSLIETIHSEKPFNVGFNVGFRLGF